MRSVAMAESERRADGETAVRRRYFISSPPACAETLLRAVRERWGVENGLHWTPDASFGEDGSVTRAENAAERVATLRRLALNLLKIGVAARRKRAGWDLERLRSALRVQMQ